MSGYFYISEWMNSEAISRSARIERKAGNRTH